MISILSYLMLCRDSNEMTRIESVLNYGLMK